MRRETFSKRSIKAPVVGRCGSLRVVSTWLYTTRIARLWQLFPRFRGISLLRGSDTDQARSRGFPQGSRAEFQPSCCAAVWLNGSDFCIGEGPLCSSILEYVDVCMLPEIFHLYSWQFLS